ncbi:MAG: hypothetical protein IKW67_04160, partial [Alphaproteobacteria bacterium]|nr:hypothetical protein [Alphaproteobacteria bacterium]
MKYLKFLVLFICCAFPLVSGAQVATTAGSNLTAWNGDIGATNNNNWNSLMNSRTPGGAVDSKVTADFGNCNSLILRCAQPKCAGCTSIDLARPIVSGCVNSNKNCKKYGNDLIEAISAQLVAAANTKVQEQQLQAQADAAKQASAQSSAQMEQMQQQMVQMQQQMTAQNQQQMAQMQAALDEQRRVAEEAQKKLLEAQAVKAEAAQTAAQASAVADDGLTQRQRDAVRNNVEADLVAREKIAGKIMDKLEGAEKNLKALRNDLDLLFEYAGCDARGNNCAGPKRVSRFKELAKDFFPTYDSVIGDVYDALQDALAAGVDISDVIMMMNGGCNRWGKFLCRYSEYDYKTVEVSDSNGTKKTKKVLDSLIYDVRNCVNERSVATGNLRGGQTCRVGTAVPPQDDVRCTQVDVLDNNSKVLREWYIESEEEDGLVRVGCATSALDSIKIFGSRNRRAGTTLDLDVLERVLYQDAPSRVVSKDTGNKYQRSSGRQYYHEETDTVKYCALTERGYQNLLAAINTNRMPSKICVPYDSLGTTYDLNGAVASGSFEYGLNAGLDYIPVRNKQQCDDAGNGSGYAVVEDCRNGTSNSSCNSNCVSSGGCNCNIMWNEETSRCEIKKSDCIYNNDLGVVTKETHKKNVSCERGD